ncbi:YgdI/YgdR family lipoprotein [Romboutsia lituseburensis]|uniref:YgdI/YgdR family lipoprotein n=1 Tax=Romboutsia lituseburensis TaxID=1537 RepID=UPI00215A86C5|nr:YgdI/YgdR family lipoprotein [Romboutsia lituseburensis]MCR8744901.1 YgdI/YgdR family lipoprotein [Romboutsia lituseburensis]
MGKKKIFILLIALSMLIFSGCSSTDAISENNSPDIVVKGLTLKISLIQTAYEMYNVNVSNPDKFSESFYKNSSKNDYKHYKWLVKSYESMDVEMKKALNNLFLSRDSWDYINIIISLDDNCSVEDIITKINSDDSLNLPSFLKKDLDKFLKYFYNEYFEDYINKKDSFYAKKAHELNKKLSINDVNVLKFVEKMSGVTLDKNYKSIMYYSFNPVETHSFEYDNFMISTISSNSSILDVVSLPFYKYSRPLFKTLSYNKDFLILSNQLQKKEDFVHMYNDLYTTSYPFEDWCLENLISGFAKYLEYRYYGSTYEHSNYVYDLKFYNYLRDINFDPNKTSLEKVSLDFYKSVLD